LSARGLVVKHVDVAELIHAHRCRRRTRHRRLRRARRTPPTKTWRPSGYRTGPPACAKSRAEKQPVGESTQEKKGRGGRQSNVRNFVCKFGTENIKYSGARACIPNEPRAHCISPRPAAPRRCRSRKNNKEDAQWGRVNITDFM